MVVIVVRNKPALKEQTDLQLNNLHSIFKLKEFIKRCRNLLKSNEFQICRLRGSNNAQGCVFGQF